MVSGRAEHAFGPVYTGSGYHLTGTGYRLTGVGYRLTGMGYRLTGMGHRLRKCGLQFQVWRDRFARMSTAPAPGGTEQEHAIPEL